MNIKEALNIVLSKFDFKKYDALRSDTFSFQGAEHIRKEHRDDMLSRFTKRQLDNRLSKLNKMNEESKTCFKITYKSFRPAENQMLKECYIFISANDFNYNGVSVDRLFAYDKLSDGTFEMNDDCIYFFRDDNFPSIELA